MTSKTRAKRSPTLKINFTKATLDSLPLPAAGERATYHDTKQPGLQLRVTSGGVKTFAVFKRVAGGAPERVTIGRYPEWTIDAARREALLKITLLAHGESVAAKEREQSLTLAAAVAEYVQSKRRRDGLPLKQRTVDDYLAMVTPGRLTAAGKRTRGGMLASLAGKSIHAITASDIKGVYTEALKRGERQAAYAAQIMRAVLAWHGIKIEHSPFSKETHGRERIQIPPTRASGHTIQPEQLGPFWRALNVMPVTPETDYLKLLLLTGCRPGEPLKVRVGDCDLAGGRMLLRDTKNRTDHLVRLSRQALEIVQRQAEGKTGDDILFITTSAEASKVAHELVQATGIAFMPKMARATFASIAEELVSAYCLKALINHKQASDIAGTHYVEKYEKQLREGWQKVADFIEAS